MTADGSACETSPLLSKSNNAVSNQANTSNRALSNSSNHHGQAEQNGKPTDGEDHFNDEGQYQGLPKVRKQLKLIVPAVAIGVRSISIQQKSDRTMLMVVMMMTMIGLPSCGRPDHRRQCLRSHWG